MPCAPTTAILDKKQVAEKYKINLLNHYFYVFFSRYLIKIFGLGVQGIGIPIWRGGEKVKAQFNSVDVVDKFQFRLNIKPPSK